MGLTYQQAKSLGLGALHPAACGRRSAERDLLERYGAPPPESKPSKDGYNKLERRFRDEVLEPAWVRGDLARYGREPMRFRIAGGCWYTPDFLAIVRGDPMPVLVETKGWMREAARLRLSVAAAAYPDFRWLLIRRESVAGWLAWEVTAAGIAAHSTYVAWIHGGRHELADR